jgi:AmmeMemoRadiSam system protein A
MVPIYSSDSPREFSPGERQRLLEIALRSIQSGLDNQRHLVLEPASLPERLCAYRASFVTLESDGALRGCIGSLEPHSMLAEDVSYNARAAAFRDPRFSPLQAGELDALTIRVSVLSEREEMQFDSEQALIKQLRAGMDGLILQEHTHKGTFLPSVWDSLPEPADFLMHLKLKAGLPVHYWSDSMQAWRYTTESFGAGVSAIRQSGRTHPVEMLK